MEIHDVQSQNLGSPVYTLHIQETKEFPSSQLVLINDAESIGNGTLMTQNTLLEIGLDIVKIDDWQESDKGKTELPPEMGNKITRSTHIDNTNKANHEYVDKTGSSELNGNISESETYRVKMVQAQTKEITKSYLDLKEAAFAVHGLDLSLPIECDMCNIEFDDLEKFDAHMKEHEETKRYMCQLCSKTYMSWQNLVAHRKELLENMLKETRETVERSEVDIDSENEDQEEKSVFFRCKTCTEEISMETYLTHKKMHPDICVFYKCPYCERVFYTHSRFISHKEGHGIKEYKCKRCPRIFKNKLYWDIHKLSHVISKQYNCFNCQLEFVVPGDLSNHIKEVHNPHPERKLTCDICFMHFTVERFMKHYLLCLTQLKSQQVSVKNEQGNYTCSDCNEVFSNPKALIRHKKVHSFAKDPHLCEVCGMSIQNLGAFIAHIRSHGKEYSRKLVELNGTSENEVHNYEGTIKGKNLMCEFCGNSFRNNKLLKLHVQKHNKIKPFDCTICSMAFYTGEQLTVHMRHHTGERPYQCTVCKKSFASSGVLYAHRRLHNSTKQHVCSVCNKSFLWRSAYHNHMRSHSAIRPFKCNECSKTFLFKHKLTAHKNTHEKGRPAGLSHQCTDCGQSFSSASELQNHHENKCFLSMITFMPTSDVVNKE
ncbi:Protein suppressor of hairy wing [Gryllus bimaculatus]|nr:Protein suppressor of hairy wing [Gryllus bimaculatus]